MKISCLKVGGRTIKTVVAVFLCLMTGIIRKSDTAFYAAIAAMLCIQRTAEDSLREAFNREVATVIGWIGGMLVLLIEGCLVYSIWSAAILIFIGASYSHHQFFCFDKTGKRDIPHVRCFSVHYCDAWKWWKPFVIWGCTDFGYYDWHCDCLDNKPVSNPPYID